MELRKVKPSEIVIPEVRVTARFDEDLYQQFRESIKAVGQITPPIVYEVGEQLVLCDGLHRIQEAIADGDKAIDVAVLPGDMMDVLTKNIFLDHLRGKTPVSQMVTVLKTLYQDYNLDPDQIREKTGLTRDYIERLLKIGMASPAVQEALDSGWIGVGHAYEISRLPYIAQQEELIAKQQVYRFPIKDLKELIDDTLEEMGKIPAQAGEAATPSPSIPRKYLCEGCKEDTDPKYLRPVFLCPNCFGEVWRIGKARQEVNVEESKETGGD